MPLPYETVALAIRRGQVAPVYLLAGPDGLQRAEVITALRERVHELGVQRVDGGGVGPADVVGVLRTPSFVPGRLVIVDDPPWVLPPRRGGDADSEAEPEGAKGKAPQEKPLLDYLEAPATGAVLVLAAQGEADKRRRLTKRAAERGVFVEAVPPRDPTPWLRERAEHLGLRLSPALLDALSARLRLSSATCERMDQELRKLQAYGPGLDRETLDLLVPPDHEERLYDLVDAVLDGQVGRALQLAATLREQGEPVARMIYALGNQLRTLVLVADACRGGVRPEAVAGKLGLHPFVARKALDQSRRLQPEAVADASEAVWRAEFGLKSGAVDEAAALDAAVLGVLRAAGRLAQ